MKIIDTKIYIMIRYSKPKIDNDTVYSFFIPFLCRFHCNAYFSCNFFSICLIDNTTIFQVIIILLVYSLLQRYMITNQIHRVFAYQFLLLDILTRYRSSFLNFKFHICHSLTGKKIHIFAIGFDFFECETSMHDDI